MNPVLRAVIAASVLGMLTWTLTLPVGGSFRIGEMLEPVDGLYRTARRAAPHESGPLYLDAMDEPVEIVIDDRGVPHIFAESDKDATIALGYVVARDRLFQMEFIKRAATGTLAEMMGGGAVSTDRHFRSIGLPYAIRQNVAEHRRQGGERADIVDWYAAGANAWINSLAAEDVPLEFRLVGAAPSPFDASNVYAILGYMTYDLSFRSSDIAYSVARQRMSEDEFNLLYPRYSSWEVPIFPESAMSRPAPEFAADEHTGFAAGLNVPPSVPEADPMFEALTEGLLDGKGSNNWAVAGWRSATGMPILAGDMHLGLSLPAVWYEVHMVTPTANVYGVTFPNAASIVEGITPTTAWAFTNTGSDQIDTYRLQTDESGASYLFDGEYRPFESMLDTIRVADGSIRVDTLRRTHFGPVIEEEGATYALRWVGHEFGTTFDAIWDMNRATEYAEFERAIRQWDYPMQNILYAGADSVVALRSTGYLPIRGSGSGFGVLDGTTSRTQWTGRVPFDDLPHMINPTSGVAASTNQRPAGPWYPHYIGRDWNPIFRSIRIDTLLSAKELHTPSDLMDYQADVYAVQADALIPRLLELTDLPPEAARVRDRLISWDRHMSTDSPEATYFYRVMDYLDEAVWDEPVFDGAAAPKWVRMFDIEGTPYETYLDRVDTDVVESLDDLLSESLVYAADPEETPAWGDVHHVVFRHITRSDALGALWRGPFSYPGFEETLSPARGLRTTHSASWRVVVDFSQTPPRAWGVYPGGQSGDPLSSRYDTHLPAFLTFSYYPLSLAASPDDVVRTPEPVSPDNLTQN